MSVGTKALGLVLLLGFAVVISAVLVEEYATPRGPGYTSSRSQSNSPTYSSSSQARSSTLNMTIGAPSIDYQNFTYNGASVEFPGSERFPLTIRSQTATTITLAVSNVPLGIWAEFIPDRLQNVGPLGANSTLLVAGAIRPLTAYLNNLTISLVANDSSGHEQVMDLPVARVWNLSIISSPNPIAFANRWTIDPNGSFFQVYGVVYDPPDQANDSMSVNFKVLGIDQAGTVMPLPSWLQLGLPIDSFSLAARIPYYFIAEANTSSAPPGMYWVAIQESINGQTFATDLQIIVSQPISL